MSATQPLDSPISPPRQDRLRVVDVGRWLWLMTAAALVLGFFAVRELSGVDDAPQVEATDNATVEPVVTPTDASDKETIHTLIPVTSQDPFSPSADDHAGAPFDGHQRVSHDEWPPLAVPMEAASDGPVVK
jgi:hypothetical protein